MADDMLDAIRYALEIPPARELDQPLVLTDQPLKKRLMERARAEAVADLLEMQRSLGGRQ